MTDRLAKPTVLIFRDRLLPGSETFVRAQGEALSRFAAVYAGSRRIPGGLGLPDDRTIVVDSGGIIGTLSHGLFKTIGFAPQFIRRIARLRPVLVHAHFGVDATLALPLVRSLRIPLVVTFHGYDATVSDEYAKRSFYAHRRYPSRRRALQEQAQLFIAVSDFVRGRLISQGFPADRTVVHYIGVNLDLFRSDSTVRRQPTVLFVGRLVEQKGCRYLIRAMADVQQAVEEARLVIIGDGPLRPDLELCARDVGCRVSFLGAQGQDEVRAWMNKASVLSVPSIRTVDGATEGFGLVFAEAQAMGLPVVTFATGGIPEAVCNGETGFLVSEGDLQGLSVSITRLLTDQQLWTHQSQAAVLRARRLFDLKRQTHELEELYGRVIEAHQ